MQNKMMYVYIVPSLLFSTKLFVLEIDKNNSIDVYKQSDLTIYKSELTTKKIVLHSIIILHM